MNRSTIPNMTWLDSFLNALTQHKSTLWRSLKTSREWLRSTFLPSHPYNILCATTDLFYQCPVLLKVEGTIKSLLEQLPGTGFIPWIGEIYSFFMTQGMSHEKESIVKLSCPLGGGTPSSGICTIGKFTTTQHMPLFCSSCESQSLTPGLIIFY